MEELDLDIDFDQIREIQLYDEDRLAVAYRTRDINKAADELERLSMDGVNHITIKLIDDKNRLLKKEEKDNFHKYTGYRKYLDSESLVKKKMAQLILDDETGNIISVSKGHNKHGFIIIAECLDPEQAIKDISDDEVDIVFINKREKQSETLEKIFNSKFKAPKGRNSREQNYFKRHTDIQNFVRKAVYDKVIAEDQKQKTGMPIPGKTKSRKYINIGRYEKIMRAYNKEIRK